LPANSKRIGLVVASVFLMAMMLRAPLTSLGPILDDITKSFGLAGYEVALLTSLPILCFGVGAFAGPWLVRRYGLRHSFTIILSTMTLGILIRPWFGFGVMLACSVAIGLAIALSNVLFPTLIRSEFPNNVPRMTAFYTLVLPIFASIAAATAVPWMLALGDWRLSTAIWGLPGLAAVVVWQFSNRTDAAGPAGSPASVHSSKQVWQSPVTWGIVGFFGLQSVGYYGVINWLPSILISQGYNQSQAGEIIGFTTMIGIPFGFAITSNLKRFKSLTVLITAISLMTSVGFATLLLGSAYSLLAGALIGIGMASTFPLSLALIAIKAHTPETTTLLSAISQGLGYLLAAAGTFTAGLLHLWSGGWALSIVMFVALSLMQIMAGVIAAKRSL